MHYLISTRAHEYYGSIHPTMQSEGGMKEMLLFFGYNCESSIYFSGYTCQLALLRVKVGEKSNRQIQPIKSL